MASYSSQTRISATSIQQCPITCDSEMLHSLSLQDSATLRSQPQLVSSSHGDSSTIQTSTYVSRPHIISLEVPKDLLQYVHYVRAQYRRKKFPTYFKHPEHVKIDKFIKLALVHKSKDADKMETEANMMLQLQGKVDEMCRMRTPLDIKEVGQLSDGTTPHSILVEGAPGIGKTTFAWEMCRQWEAGCLLQQWLIVVMLQLRVKRVRQATSLHDLFYHPSLHVRQAVCDYILTAEGAGLLLILEGYDELSYQHMESDQSIFQQLLTGDLLPSSTVMVTSRPVASKQLPSAFLYAVDQHIEILGFTDVDIEEYLESACQSKPDLLRDFKLYLSSHPFAASVMYIPLQCAVISELYTKLWKKGEKGFAPRTLTELYTALVQSLMLRYLSEHPVYSQQELTITKLSDLPEQVRKELAQLAAFAAKGIEQQQYVFDRIPCNTMGLMQHVEDVETEETPSASYSFLHLTLQEYLAALHWSQLPIQELVALLKRPNLFPLYKLVREGFHEKRESTVYHWPVLLFIAGLTQLSEISGKLFISLFSQGQTVVQWKQFSASVCRLLFECQNSELVSAMFTNDRFSALGDTNLEWYVNGYCIAHSSSTALWYIHYDHKLRQHNTQHLHNLVKGLGRSPTREQGGKIDVLLLVGDQELNKCIEFIPKLLPYTRELKVLDLRGQLSDWENSAHGLQQIILSHHTRMEIFAMMTSDNAAKWSPVLTSLDRLTSLKRLTLKFSGLNEAKLPPQQCHSLEHLVLYNFYTPFHSFLVLPNAETLTRLSLKMCYLNGEDTVKLIRLPNCKIQLLELMCCSMATNDFCALVKAVASNGKLTTFKTLQNNIGLEGAIALADTMKRTRTLRNFDVLEDSIGFKGAKKLAAAMKYSTMEKLVLPIQFKSAIELSRPLQNRISFDSPSKLQRNVQIQ